LVLKQTENVAENLENFDELYNMNELYVFRIFIFSLYNKLTHHCRLIEDEC